MQCSLLRHDYPVARDAYNKIPDIGRDEPVTRYLMYKVGLRSGDISFGKRVFTGQSFASLRS